MPQFPSWYRELHRSILRRLATFPADPFTQPADTSSYVALHTNDYLSLAGHDEVIEARCSALRRAGLGTMAASVFAADFDHHRSFLDRAVEVGGAEDGFVTSSGWSANVGLIEAIGGSKRSIYIDRFAHASIWAGAKLARGTPRMLPHNRPDLATPILERYGPGVLVIDAVYSTTGAAATIPAYAELAEHHDCLLVVDESHSFGIYGHLGGGLSVAQDCHDRVHFRTVSLAKALAGSGGLVLGDAASVRWLRYRANPLVFSTSPQPAASAAHDAALQIIGREPERAGLCLARADLLRSLLRDAGVDFGPSVGPITSLFFDRELAAPALYDLLKRQGILSSVFVAPATPRHSSLLRFSTHSELATEDIVRAARMIVSGLEALGLRSRYRE